MSMSSDQEKKSESSESSEYDHEADNPESTESDMDPDQDDAMPDDAPPPPPVASAAPSEPVGLDVCNRCDVSLARYDYQGISLCKQCIRCIDHSWARVMREKGVDEVTIKAIVKGFHDCDLN